MKPILIVIVLLMSIACFAQNCDRENEINSIRAQRDAGTITVEQAGFLVAMQRDAWTACNLAVLQSNTAAFEEFAPQLEQAAIAIHVMAYKKWCHQSLWRRIRGYRQPKWCAV